MRDAGGGGFYVHLIHLFKTLHVNMILFSNVQSVIKIPPTQVRLQLFLLLSYWGEK